MDAAKQCPWCNRWCLKDNNCNYIFACGLTDKGIFTVGTGCGNSWCFLCGKKLCGPYINAFTGKRSEFAKEEHTTMCCKSQFDFSENTYCSGGHNSHCPKRW